MEHQTFLQKKNLKTEQDWLDYSKEVSEMIAPLIPKSEIGLTDEKISCIEDSLKSPSNWFLHAKSQKENGFYADYINGMWHAPSNADKEKYEVAKKYALQLFDIIGKMLEKTITNNSFESRLIKLLLKEYKAQLHNSALFYCR